MAGQMATHGDGKIARLCPVGMVRVGGARTGSGERQALHRSLLGGSGCGYLLGWLPPSLKDLLHLCSTSDVHIDPCSCQIARRRMPQRVADVRYM